ncbi:MAG: hypothetical protein QM607_09285 [Microbacterium sp.]
MIDGFEVHGTITIAAPGVVIKNTRVIGGTTPGDSGLVNNIASGDSFEIIDSELVPQVQSTLWNGIMGSNFTATRVNIHGVVDPIHIIGDNVTVTDSYLHDTYHLEQDPLRDYTPTHDDIVQIQIGKNLLFENNTMSGSQNTVFMVTQDRGSVGDMTISDNYLDGGNCSINVNEKSNGPLSDVLIDGNLFGPNRTISYCAVYIPPTSDITLTENYWEATGELVEPVWRY